ncbi:MAG: DNA internalization-related competence protein ComEC/Rec2 [Rhodothermales bacterium]
MHSIHRYPALYLAAGLAAGIALAPRLPASGCTAGLVGGAFAAAGVPLVYRLAGRRLVSPAPLTATALVVIAAASLGAASYLSFNRHVFANEVALQHASAPGAALLYGRVAGVPRRDSTRTVFTLAIDSVDALPRPSRASGSVRITIRDTLSGLSAGQRIRIRARISIPQGQRNPHAFSYRAYLAHQGIHTVGTVDTRAGLDVLAPAAGLDRRLDAVRRFIERALAHSVQAPEARGIVRALLTGNRDDLDPERMAQLSRTGLSHLLAVSGLHVLLVGMLLYSHLGPLLMRFGMSWRWMESARAVATLAVLVGYGLLVGGRPSVVRAVVMAGSVLAGHLFQRPVYPLNGLGVAGAALLIIHPASLFDLGFQLSFAAVGAIVGFGDAWQRRMPASVRDHRVSAWLSGMLLVSAAATLGTAPVMVRQWGEVPVAGVLLNIPAIPAASLALICGLLTVLTYGLNTGISEAFGAVTERAVQAVVLVADRGDAWLPFLRIPVAWNGVAGLVVFCGLLGILHPGLSARWRWRLALVALAAVLGSMLEQATRAPALTVLYFDVGQGDAALVRFPNGRHLLIDAGPADGYVDQGERTILPFLLHAGIRKIDTVLLTHPHSDHIGGLPAVLRRVSVGRIVLNMEDYAHPTMQDIQQLAARNGVRLQQVTAGDTLAIDPTVHALVLAPSSAPSLSSNPNERSVVLRVQYGDTRFLFMGDAEAGAERELVTRYPQLLRAEAIKVGHHGSRTSSTAGMVDRVAVASGGRAVVSVARVNRYGLPDEDVLARWEAAGVDLLSTDRRGAIWLRSDGTQVAELDWR